MSDQGTSKAVVNRGLQMWTVYKNPSDFPGKFVVRRSEIGPGTVTMDGEPLAVVDSLEEARAAIPKLVAGQGQTLRMARNPADDPVIVEVWL